MVWRGHGRGGIRRVCRCSRCLSAFVEPMPEEDTLQAHYSASYFTRFYGGDRKTALRSCSGVLERAEGRLGGRPGRVLDVGCGVGDLSVAAHRRGWKAIGIESAPEAARQAAGRGIEVVPGQAATLLGAEGTGPPSLAGPFDLVVFRDVVGHLPEAGRALRGAVSRLRSGGWLAVRTPNRHAGVFRVARLVSRVRDASGILHLPAQVLHVHRPGLDRILAGLGLDARVIEGESDRAAGGAVRYSDRLLADWFWRGCLAVWERRGEPESLWGWGRKP